MAPLGRIRSKLDRAKQRYEEHYADWGGVEMDGVGRVYLSLTLGAEEKQQSRAVRDANK